MSQKSHEYRYGRGGSRAAVARREGKKIVRERVREEQIAAAQARIASGEDPEVVLQSYGSLSSLAKFKLKKMGLSS